MGGPEPEGGRVVLYRSVPAGWSVDAWIRKSGDLAICSGGTSDEWYVYVPASRIPALKAALAHGQPHRSGALLDLLSARFAATPGAANPFEEIKAFLARSGIPFTLDRW